VYDFLLGESFEAKPWTLSSSENITSLGNAVNENQNVSENQIIPNRQGYPIDNTNEHNDKSQRTPMSKHGLGFGDVGYLDVPSSIVAAPVRQRGGGDSGVAITTPPLLFVGSGGGSGSRQREWQAAAGMADGGEIWRGQGRREGGSETRVGR
jgi:hypothetical protein